YRSVFRKLQPESARARVSPEAFRRNVDDMVRWTLEAGGQPLLLSPPFSEHMQEDHPTVGEYQRAIASVSAERDATMVDLQPLFVKHPDEEVYFPDMFHFNRRGHAIAAEAIRAAVANFR
ncbi:MAG: SGNH/GDSL hydrolase family protein, partial [Rhodospirillales bacterium]|nr:SGNH/GDSL hydrolase family protein [Rhodospirillales bacterium]